MNARLILPLLLLATLPGQAQAMSRAQADSLVAAAEQAYAAGEHAQALVLFDSVHTTWSSAGLLLNIGNCHFKLGDLPQAILHYERAARLAPGDADIRTNLDHARAQVVDRLAELPGFSLGAGWTRWRSGAEVDTWARRSLWSWTVFFALLAVGLLLHHRLWRTMAFSLAGLALLLSVVAVGLAALRHAEVRNTEAAIILQPKVDVRGEPRNGATVLFMLHKGTKVQVLQERDAWYEVQLPNGNVGWMPPGSLERI